MALLACGSAGDESGSAERNSFKQEGSNDSNVVYYTNGVIWTGVEGQPDASVMLIENNQISYVGDGSTVRVAADKVVDLDGAFVMPGFIDNHIHLFDGGVSLASVDLRDADSPKEFTRRIKNYASTLQSGQWVRMGNWDHELWGGELPSKDWIDQFTPATPVFVFRLDGHMALANSVALELAGISADTVSPAGGEIVRDEQGEPTGLLKDNAIDLVAAQLPKFSDDELVSIFEAAQTRALSVGLTQVHAVSANSTETNMLDAIRLAYDRGKMKLRVKTYTPLEDWNNTAKLVASQGKGDERLSWGGLKGFVDGSLGSTTAWFYQPYEDDPDTSGFALSDPDELKALIAEADQSGLKLAVHAIGDRAIDVLIDSYEAAAGDNIVTRRYRIEHFQHPTAAAIKRAARLGIIASMHPYHAIDDGRWAEERIGVERLKTTYAFRSILDAGGKLTFGSDWPVAPLAPLEGVYAAVTRRTTDGANPDGWQPQEKISVEEALTAYTSANAYAAFEEDRVGTLASGKQADFVVLSQDPRVIDPAAINRIDVMTTVIDGEVVYQKTH